MKREIGQIMREGQEKTLEQVALLEKQMAGTITPDESVRLGMLTGNLLALMKEAQAQGVGVGVGTGYGEVEVQGNDEVFDDEDEDSIFGDEDLFDEDTSEDEDEPICACGDPDCGYGSW